MRGWDIQSGCDFFKESYYWRMCVRGRIWALISYDSKIIIWKEVETDNWKSWMWPIGYLSLENMGWKYKRCRIKTFHLHSHLRAVLALGEPKAFLAGEELSWQIWKIWMGDIFSLLSLSLQRLRKESELYISQVICWIREIKETSQVPWSLVGRGWHDDGKLPGDGVINVMLEQSSWGTGSLWEML